MAALSFQLQYKDAGTKARAGKINTDHGEILTPVFMPVGTAGSVKAVTQQQLLKDVKAQIILGNTYHLYLRPGLEVIEAAGGLHQFNGWHKPILTDSGGYQVFSLANNRKLTEEGAIFQSHIDGSKHLFSPEKVMDIQRIIGGDIIMAFDECPPYPSDYDYAKKSMELTHRWLTRCFTRFDETPDRYVYTQNLFPIIQGSTYNYAGYAATKGFAIMQDATADFGNLSLTARLAVFNTDDYDNRQYAYENDVLYAFSFPAYYQHGIRHYLMANYKINQHFTATIRWSRTDLFGEATYGSGLDEIAVPHRSEGRVQVAWRF